MTDDFYAGFSHHELVETSNDESTIELLTCDACGAVVRAITVDVHRDWHIKLTAATGTTS